MEQLLTAYYIILGLYFYCMWRWRVMSDRIEENNLGRINGDRILKWTPHAEIKYKRYRVIYRRVALACLLGITFLGGYTVFHLILSLSSG